MIGSRNNFFFKYSYYVGQSLEEVTFYGIACVSVDESCGVNPTAYNGDLHPFFASRVLKLSIVARPDFKNV
jgi:hypothetical protein